jgi:hypothetical protein
MHAELHFDVKRNVIAQKIDQGEFITADEYQTLTGAQTTNG